MEHCCGVRAFVNGEHGEWCQLLANQVGAGRHGKVVVVVKVAIGVMDVNGFHAAI